MPQKQSVFSLTGGMDVVTAAIAVPPGKAIAALNYEPVASGYRRVQGYERFDGRLAPSAATFAQFAFTDGTTAIEAGDVLTGQTSGATAVVLDDAVLVSGDYGDGDAAGYVGVGVITGTFQNGETLTVSGSPVAIADGVPQVGLSPDDETAAEWLAAARANARAAIQPVPGEGPVRGVWYFKGKVIAFRDKVGGTEGGMYQSTGSGWEEVEMPLVGTPGEGTDIVAYAVQIFDKDGALPDSVDLVGKTITGSTSGATAEITIVFARQVQSNGWDSAVVYLDVDNISGTFAYWEPITISDLTLGDGVIFPSMSPIYGDAGGGLGSPLVLAPGGRYEFITQNFYGAANLKKVYGVNGVDPAFSFDGAAYARIQTKMPEDKPHRIAVHKMALVLGFPGGSTQISAVGSAETWDPVFGASEIMIGDEIVDYVPNVQGALVMLGRNTISILYGNDVTDYRLEPISDEAGALPWTAEKMGTPIYMDNRGVRSLSTTASFGNFNLGTMTNVIQPLLNRIRESGVNPCASTRVRSKDQYRLFFDNGYGLTIFFGHKTPEILPFHLGKVVTCICSIEDDDEREAIWFGSEDGYVYQLDRGVDFDGEPIDYYLRLPFNHANAPNVRKRYHRAIIECESAAPATLRISAEFDYGNSDVHPNVADLFTMPTSGGQWDVSDWDDFIWDAPVEGQAECYIDGFGKNISLTLAGSVAGEHPHTLKSVSLFHSDRGLSR